MVGQNNTNIMNFVIYIESIFLMVYKFEMDALLYLRSVALYLGYI